RTNRQYDAWPAPVSAPQLGLDRLASGLDLQGWQALPEEEAMSRLVGVAAQLLDLRGLDIGEPGEDTEQILVVPPGNLPAQLIRGQEADLERGPCGLQLFMGDLLLPAGFANRQIAVV